MNRSLYHLLWRETQRRAEDRDRIRHVDDLRKNRRQEEKVGFLKSPYWSVLTVTNSDDDDVISAQEKGCSVFKQYFNATVPNLLCSKDRLAGTRRFHIKKLNGNDQIIFECWLLAWVLNVSVTWRPDSSPVQHCPLANENKNTSKLKRICLQLKKEKWDEERSRENELKKRRFSRGPFSQFWSEGPSHCHKSTGIPSVPTASKTKLVFSFSAVV